jgi:hypothetical protein
MSYLNFLNYLHHKITNLAYLPTRLLFILNIHFPKYQKGHFGNYLFPKMTYIYSFFYVQKIAYPHA